jgi:hypothetical protein
MLKGYCNSVAYFLHAIRFRSTNRYLLFSSSDGIGYNEEVGDSEREIDRQVPWIYYF